MYLLFRTDFYIFRNFVFFVFLVVQYRRSVICKIKRLDTNTRDFGYNLNCVKICARDERTATPGADVLSSMKKKKKNLMGVGILPLPMYLRDLNLNQNEQACEKG